MKKTSIYLQWRDAGAPDRFATGVSLHSHTLHSKESLDFIYKAARQSAALAWVVRKSEREYRRANGTELDLSRGWWTPPLAPADAHRVEAGQIRGLGLAPLVSLSDHDDIEAPMSLQAMEPGLAIPVSVEWTVPYGATFFHIGVHNLPAARARAIMSELAAYTKQPKDKHLKELLAMLAALPDVLIVFNHPMWDEKGVGDTVHRIHAREFLMRFRPAIHALEINGLRPWRENRAALQMAEEYGMPAVAGGDRHTLEPNVVLNFTSASSFAEFAAEVRGGLSHVWIGEAYRHSHAARVFHNMIDVFRTYEDHGLGWSEWPDRVFFRKDNGAVVSLTDCWGGHLPGAIGVFGGFMRLAGQPRLRSAIHSLLPRVEPAAFGR